MISRWISRVEIDISEKHIEIRPHLKRRLGIGEELLCPTGSSEHMRALAMLHGLGATTHVQLSPFFVPPGFAPLGKSSSTQMISFTG